MRFATGMALLLPLAVLASDRPAPVASPEKLAFTHVTVIDATEGTLDQSRRHLYLLTLLGIRKRAITSGRWSLRAWTSAHVYLGLSLIVIATLHTGFSDTARTAA